MVSIAIHIITKLYIIIIIVFTINIVDAQPLPPHDDHNKVLHFSHPLVAESPSPDTKIRADYLYMNLNEDDLKMHTFVVEAEYAFFRWLSLEFDVPYTILSNEITLNRLNNIEVGIKYANFTFEETGLLLGGGIELGLPTGSDETGIGSSTIWEVEPFLDFGYKNAGFETVGFAKFGFPVNGGEEEADFEFGWNLSLLYQITIYIEGLVEFSGERISGGREDGFSTTAVIPGIKIKPVQSINFKIGFGYIIPITDEKEINNGSILSVFYHF
jgi:hypothetical protein